MRDGDSRIRLGVRQSIEELTNGRISKRGGGAAPRDHGPAEPARMDGRAGAEAGIGDWERAP